MVPRPWLSTTQPWRNHGLFLAMAVCGVHLVLQLESLHVHVGLPGVGGRRRPCPGELERVGREQDVEGQDGGWTKERQPWSHTCARRS